MLPYSQVNPSTFNLRCLNRRYCEDAAALLHFRRQIGIHQCRAPVQNGTNLQRRDSRSAAQIRPRQIRSPFNAVPLLFVDLFLPAT
jgi:hypothetical protein